MSEHGPSLTRSFLSGLTKYKLAMYANKPSQIDAVAAAKYGCINGGKDWLVCGICNVSWVLAGRNGMANEADSVCRVPLLPRTPSFTAHELRTIAIAPDPIVSKLAEKNIPLYVALNTLPVNGWCFDSCFWRPFFHASRRKHDANVLHRRPFWLASRALILLSRSPTHNVHASVSFSIVRSLYGFFASMPPSPALSCSFTDREGTPTPMAGPSASPHIGRSASRIQLSASPVRPRRVNDAVPNRVRQRKPWKTGQGLFPATENAPDGASHERPKLPAHSFTLRTSHRRLHTFQLVSRSVGTLTTRDEPRHPLTPA
ncbi:hypothetical protein PISMIDRAFT_16690 [Pisolithus microcarpus 441]|uniref:C3HC-type domain-containing protein n=1 Tax=Pisolithus microcarpus 441 TaxID=765257 RepID=A0A0C9YF03_9AGAM|nr:hypothetical protein PISMIDRAFT_16690 [Pisolithus microcarpus 441]